jgi:hypothetical protein
LTLVSYTDKRSALDADAVLADARHIAGLPYFGDDQFMDALHAMLDCYAQDIQVDELGLVRVRETIVRQLVNRARFERDLVRHPEIRDEDVSDPIVILGMPRSGTTKVHRMLGSDPNLLKNYMWQMLNPAPFPGWERGGPDARIAAARSDEPLIQATEENPALRAGHVYGAEEVTTDLWLAALTFNDTFYSSLRPPSPAYHHYLLERERPSNRDNFEYLAGLYRYLQWQQGGRQNRRWLMKNEALLGFVGDFLQVHPKATFVHLHRDPRVAIPSFVKLMTEMSRPLFNDITPSDMIFTIVERLSILSHRYLRLRDQLDLDDRILDVPYEKIRKDPMPVYRELYRRAGHELTAESEALMLAYERENEQGKHGAHVYSLEMFGLSNRIIEQHFSQYIRRFIEPSLSPGLSQVTG